MGAAARGEGGGGLGVSGGSCGEGVEDGGGGGGGQEVRRRRGHTHEKVVVPCAGHLAVRDLSRPFVICGGYGSATRWRKTERGWCVDGTSAARLFGRRVVERLEEAQGCVWGCAGSR